MEINIYRDLNKDTVPQLMYTLDWFACEDTDLECNMFCPGGSILASWGLASTLRKLKERGVRRVANVQGLCASMGTILLPFFDKVTALDLESPTIMIHRGAYEPFDENGKKTVVTKQMQDHLDADNRDMYNALKTKINEDEFKAELGYPLSQLFDPSKPRVDCWLTARQAKKIGLVDEVIPLTDKTSNVVARAEAVAKLSNSTATAATAVTTNKNKMNVEELKRDHPELFNAVYSAGVASAKTDEEDPCAGCTKKKQAKADNAEASLEKAVTLALTKLGLTVLANSSVPNTALATAKAALTETEAQMKAEAEAKTRQDAEAKTLADLEEQFEGMRVTFKK